MKNAIGHELCPELMQSLGLELHDAPQQKDTATLQQRLQSNGKLMNSLEDAIRAAGLRDGHEFCAEQYGQRQQRRNADGKNIVKLDHKTPHSFLSFVLLSIKTPKRGKTSHALSFLSFCTISQ